MNHRNGLLVSQYSDLSGHRTVQSAKPESAQDGSTLYGKKGVSASTQSIHKPALFSVEGK